MHAFCTQAVSSSFLNPLPVPIHPSLNLWQRRQEWRRAYLRGDEARIQNLHSVSSLTVSVALGSTSQGTQIIWDLVKAQVQIQQVGWG